MVGATGPFRPRLFGFGLTATTSVNARFTMHYNEVFKTGVSRPDAPSTDYDAFYVLAYASTRSATPPPTGANLAAAMKRLVPPGPTHRRRTDEHLPGVLALERGRVDRS